jgi:hypothetical protein
MNGMGNLIRISSSSRPAREYSRVHEGSDAGSRPSTIPAWESEESMLDQLDRRDRLRLVEFVCSFAWADLEIRPEERVFISRLIRRLGLDEDEDLQVQRWLDRPPSLDEIDPTSIPAAHRRIFVESIEGLIASDGEVAAEESETLEIFKQLLVG